MSEGDSAIGKTALLLSDEEVEALRRGEVPVALHKRIERRVAERPKHPGKRMIVELTPSERSSQIDRLRHAEGLILQLPHTHEGRNTWLLNYGLGDEATAMRRLRPEVPRPNYVIDTIPQATPRGWGPHDLTFAALREANTRRLPLFKGNAGQPAHSKDDGSDWSLNDWIVAVTGELGELANLAKKLRRGDFTLDTPIDRPKDRGALGFGPHGTISMTYGQWMREEVADIIIYLDILAKQIGAVDLGQLVRKVFNKKSDEIRVDVKL